MCVTAAIGTPLTDAWRVMNEAPPDKTAEAVKKFIGKFAASKGTTLEAASLGQTDVTLIGTWVEPSAIGLGKFVFKMITPEQLQNAQVCSLALSILGEKTPNIIDLGPKSLKDQSPYMLFGGYAKKNRTVHGPLLSKKPHHFAFMKAFEGATIQDLALTKTFDEFSPKDLTTLWQRVGEIAIFDLFTGNDDRFFRIKKYEKGFESHFMNPGNLMVKVNLMGNLEEIYCIDNTTFNSERSADPEDRAKYVARFQEVILSLRTQKGKKAFAGAVMDGLDAKGVPLLIGEKTLPTLCSGIEEGLAKVRDRKDGVLSAIHREYSRAVLETPLCKVLVDLLTFSDKLLEKN